MTEPGIDTVCREAGSIFCVLANLSNLVLWSFAPRGVESAVSLSTKNYILTRFSKHDATVSTRTQTPSIDFQGEIRRLQELLASTKISLNSATHEKVRAEANAQFYQRSYYISLAIVAILTLILVYPVLAHYARAIWHYFVPQSVDAEPATHENSDPATSDASSVISDTSDSLSAASTDTIGDPPLDTGASTHPITHTDVGTEAPVEDANRCDSCGGVRGPAPLHKDYIDGASQTDLSDEAIAQVEHRNQGTATESPPFERPITPQVQYQDQQIGAGSSPVKRLDASVSASFDDDIVQTSQVVQAVLFEAGVPLETYARKSKADSVPEELLEGSLLPFIDNATAEHKAKEAAMASTSQTSFLTSESEAAIEPLTIEGSLISTGLDRFPIAATLSGSSSKNFTIPEALRDDAQDPSARLDMLVDPQFDRNVPQSSDTAGSDSMDRSEFSSDIRVDQSNSLQGNRSHDASSDASSEVSWEDCTPAVSENIRSDQSSFCERRASACEAGPSWLAQDADSRPRSQRGMAELRRDLRRHKDNLCWDICLRETCTKCNRIANGKEKYCRDGPGCALIFPVYCCKFYHDRSEKLEAKKRVEASNDSDSSEFQTNIDRANQDLDRELNHIQNQKPRKPLEESSRRTRVAKLHINGTQTTIGSLPGREVTRVYHDPAAPSVDGHQPRRVQAKPPSNESGTQRGPDRGGHSGDRRGGRPQRGEQRDGDRGQYHGQTPKKNGRRPLRQ